MNEMKTPGYGVAAFVMSIAGWLVCTLISCCIGWIPYVGTVIMILTGVLYLAVIIAALVMSSKCSKNMLISYGRVSGIVKAAKILSIIQLVLFILAWIAIIVIAIILVATVGLVGIAEALSEIGIDSLNIIL